MKRRTGQDRSITSKWSLHKGGAILGHDLVWETRARMPKPVTGYWFALWTAGAKWNKGAEMDVLESFGIAALEARCAGVPVVAKAGNGIAEFVRDGRDGLLVADDAAMTEAIVRLCTQPLLRTALAGHAGSTASPVSWTTTLALTEAAYEEAAVLAGRTLPRVVEVAS